MFCVCLLDKNRKLALSFHIQVNAIIVNSVEVIFKFIFSSSITNSLCNLPMLRLCIMVWQLRFTLLEYPSARDSSTFVFTAKILAFWIIFQAIWSICQLHCLFLIVIDLMPKPRLIKSNKCFD